MAMLELGNVAISSSQERESCSELCVDTQVGDRLRLRRITLGMTQVQLARLCGISAQQIHKYEMGVSRITSGRLHQFGQILNVPVAWFFGEDAKSDEGSDECIHMLNDYYSLEILKAAHSIQNSKRKAQLMRIAQLFAEED